MVCIWVHSFVFNHSQKIQVTHLADEAEYIYFFSNFNLKKYNRGDIT